MDDKLSRSLFHSLLMSSGSSAGNKGDFLRAKSLECTSQHVNKPTKVLLTCREERRLEQGTTYHKLGHNCTTTTKYCASHSNQRY